MLVAGAAGAAEDRTVTVRKQVLLTIAMSRDANCLSSPQMRLAQNRRN